MTPRQVLHLRVQIVAALGATFVIITMAITIKGAPIPRAAKRSRNASYCLGRGEKKYNSKYCGVLARGDSSGFSDIKLGMSSLIPQPCNSLPESPR